MGTVRAGGLREALPGMKSAQITYQIGKLVDRGLLQTIEPRTRIYTVKFSNSYLIRGVINSLKEEGFIPDL